MLAQDSGRRPLTLVLLLSSVGKLEEPVHLFDLACQSITPFWKILVCEALLVMQEGALEIAWELL